MMHGPINVRFFLPFPFKISLAYLLMLQSFSILRKQTIVLVRLKSKTLQVYLFYVIVVVLWWVIWKGIPRLLTKFCLVFLIPIRFILWILGNKNSQLLQYPVFLFCLFKSRLDLITIVVSSSLLLSSLVLVFLYHYTVCVILEWQKRHLHKSA